MSDTCRGCGGSALVFEFNIDGAGLQEATVAADAAGDCWIWSPPYATGRRRWSCKNDADAVIGRAMERNRPKPTQPRKLMAPVDVSTILDSINKTMEALKRSGVFTPMICIDSISAHKAEPRCCGDYVHRGGCRNRNKTGAWTLAQLDLDARFVAKMRKRAERMWNVCPTQTAAEELCRLDKKLLSIGEKIEKLSTPR